MERISLAKTKIYDAYSFKIINFKPETESTEYDACQFKLNEVNIISRSAKITPKKVGQFVTFWKRNKKGIIEPFNDTDSFDFYVINLESKNNYGQFVFPKSVLIKKGILSTNQKEGKRAFRVYPSWDTPQNKQAEQTQKWQLNYFIKINDSIDLNKIIELYKKE